MVNQMIKKKPLGHKSYGHIPHLPGSRMGSGDHKCHEGQQKIACEKGRDKYDRIIVQEKLDGSNVGIALLNETILPLTRSGYKAHTSPYKMHHEFKDWVYQNKKRFRMALKEGERICGEWLLVAHGTRYNLPHEPFVAFDIMVKQNRMPYDEFKDRAQLGEFVTPHVISDNGPFPIDDAMSRLGTHGFHGSIDPVEGAVWRIERDILINKSLGNIGGRKTIVDFLVKYVRPDKRDGQYLESESGKIIYNKFI